MQIVVKVARSSLPEAVELVTDLLRRSRPRAGARPASVAPVFPGVKEGRRAGMLVVTLDDAVSAREAEALLADLRGLDAVEYACVSAPRAAIAGSLRCATWRCRRPT